MKSLSKREGSQPEVHTFCPIKKSRISKSLPRDHYRNSAIAVYATTIIPSTFCSIRRPSLGLHIARMSPSSTTLTVKVENGSSYQLNKEQVSNFAPLALRAQLNSSSGIESLQSSPITHQVYIPGNRRLERQEESPRCN